MRPNLSIVLEVKMSVQKHFYIEKRKTLQVYHIVHRGDCPLLPLATGRSYLGEFSNFKDMLEFTGNSIGEVQKCQLCLKEVSKR